VATDINDRVDRLEAIAEKTSERLLALERDVAIIKSNYATKADLAQLRAELKVDIAEAKVSIIMWVVTAIFLAQLLPALLKRYGF
jgi:ABC-type metal ion transport system substrate-binding protein